MYWMTLKWLSIGFVQLVAGKSNMKWNSGFASTHSRTFFRSNSRDITDHSAILNINTRKEEQSIHLEKHRSVVVLGNKLAELVSPIIPENNSYNISFIRIGAAMLFGQFSMT